LDFPTSGRLFPAFSSLLALAILGLYGCRWWFLGRGRRPSFLDFVVQLTQFFKEFHSPLKQVGQLLGLFTGGGNVAHI